LRLRLAYGFEGFMPWNEVESVVEDRRPLDGWSLPIVFDVSEEELKVSGVRQVGVLLPRPALCRVEG
jgi:ATP sulfurylase